MKQLSKSLKRRLNQWDDEQRLEWRAVMSAAHDRALRKIPGLWESIEQYEKSGKVKKEE